MNRARVLLVEDDPAIRRFVQLALEDQPVELSEATTLADARRQLQDAPCALLLTDLMLPDGNGIDLLRALHDEPGLRRSARLAVFSAGLSAARREELRSLGVEHVLDKPASVGALVACVQHALDAAGTAPASPPSVATAPDVDEAGAIAKHFGGNAALFESFRAMSLAQLNGDLAAGDAALASGDRATLRRTAHNLKSVLRLMGRAPASDLAKVLEAAAAGDAPPEALAAGWRSLRAAVGATIGA